MTRPAEAGLFLSGSPITAAIGYTGCYTADFILSSAQSKVSCPSQPVALTGGPPPLSESDALTTNRGGSADG
jgi:hypothetical protein